MKRTVRITFSVTVLIQSTASQDLRFTQIPTYPTRALNLHNYFPIFLYSTMFKSCTI